MFGLGADDDAIGTHEVADRRTFAQEFGVRHDIEIRIGPGLADDLRDLAAGADRHGRFGDDDGIAVERTCDLLGRAKDIREIGMAVAAARGRADGDEHRVGGFDGAGKIGGEGEALGGNVAGDELVEAGLIDRHFALFQAGDLTLVQIDADHFDAEFREAGAGDKSDIA